MSNDFVPHRGIKRCPSCGKGCGCRSHSCKYCSHVFPSSGTHDFVPQNWLAAGDFVAACGGFAQARVALRESEAFFDQMLEFSRKYLK